MSQAAATSRRKKFALKPKGEPMVWFTAMGLAVGLTMVACLLWLILSQGLSVFWPRPAVEIRLVEGSTFAIRDSTTLGGEINKIRLKHTPRIITGEGAAPVEERRELQIFTGNKDAYGFSFKYVDEQDIAGISHPSGAIRIERMEYGDALGTPVGLVRPDGTAIPFEAPGFRSALDSLFQQSVERRAEILQIEKVRIGRINAGLRAIDLRERHLNASGRLSEEQKADFEDRRGHLNAQFDELNAKRAILREDQGKGYLKLRTFTGQEREIPLGNFVSFYFPNELGLFDKVGVFLHSIWAFLSGEPREANTEGGIFPAIFGTFVMTLLLSVAVTPFGVVAAIYLREYATQGVFVRSVRIAVNNLAGVPSIVFGVFGLGFFVYILGGSIDQLLFQSALPTPTFGTGGILWASLTLALMTVPVVIVATEEALAAVPRGMREGSLACGASKWQTIQRVVLPASSTGILTGLILAMARGAGEVAPLMLVGVVKLAPSLPLDGEFPFLHLDRKFMHLGFHIYDLGFQSPDAEAAIPMVFATTLLLIILVVLLNLTAITIRERLRKKYASGAF